MQISNVTELNSTADRAEPTAASLGQQDFLRMLIAQLENQDPLNPQEATEFSAQLAQFSSLEQEIAMRTSLEQISTAIAGGDKSTAINLIGRDVLAESAQFELNGGGATLHYDLAGPSDTTVLEIRDARGALVHSSDLGPGSGGPAEFQWDGAGLSGIPLPSGVYNFEVLAVADLVPVSTTTLIEGRVSGADVSSGIPTLRVGDVVIPLANILEVRGTSDRTGASL